MVHILDDHAPFENSICAEIRKRIPDAPVYFYWAENKVNVYVFAISPQGHVVRGGYVMFQNDKMMQYHELVAHSIYDQIEIVCGLNIVPITLALKVAIDGQAQERTD